MTDRGSQRIDIYASSDIIFDQRVLKTAQTLKSADYKVRVTGRKKSRKHIEPELDFPVRIIKLLPKSGFFFYLLFNIQLFFSSLKSNANIIWAVDLDTLPGTWLGARLSGKKIILDSHEHYIESPELSDRPLVRGVWSILARIFIPKVDLAITVNQMLATRMSSSYGIPFHVIRNMPPGQSMELNTHREKVIWYQGAVNRGRKLEILIRSLELLDDFTVEIAGDGDLSAYLQKLVTQIGLSDRVIFHGRMPYAEMQQRGAQCFAGFNMLSDEGDNYKYSLANKFFDYVQAGLPSINSSFPVYQEYLNIHTVGIELPSDIKAQELAVAINELYQSTERYNELVSNCKMASKIWIWENEKEKILELVDTVAFGRK